MRKKIVAGNWKMNLTSADGFTLVKNIAQELPSLASHQQVIICPSSIHIPALSEVKGSQLLLGAQNVHPKASGAYTGEISIDMLKSYPVSAVIIGHSERREYFHETNEFIKEKVDAILAADLTPIFCCGEPLSIRESGTQESYVLSQISDSLFHLDASQITKVVIAYEPIWAIGTGVTASTTQAQEMHSAIRASLAKKYSKDIAEEITILYGGSCNPSNAADLFSQPDIDGGLIGGASLKADQFLDIVKAMK